MPAPVLVRPPLPPMSPLRPAKGPAPTSIVPPPALSVMVRPVVNAVSNRNVPPLKLSPPDASPRLASCDTARVPALIVHGVISAVVGLHPVPRTLA